MMKPLSRRKRLFYLIGFFIVFIIATPLLIFYAKGYRWTGSLGITHTGGLFISAPESGARIYVEEELVREASIFQKNVLVQNLKPGVYRILVEKEDHSSWRKELEVFAETVTEAHPFLLVKEPTLTEITPRLPRPAVQSTTTRDEVATEKNPEYTKVVELFVQKKLATGTVPTSATSTADQKALDKLSARRIDGQVYVIWNGDAEEIPSYFCSNQICKEEIAIKSSSFVKSFDFFPGRSDLIIISNAEGIFVSEIDDRSPQNIIPLLLGSNMDMRVNSNTIYVKQADRFYSVGL